MILRGLYVDCSVCDKQRLDYEGACMVSENIFNSCMLDEFLVFIRNIGRTAYCIIG